MIDMLDLFLLEAENGTKLVLNKDTALVEKIQDRIEKRDGHCPCRVEENEDTICPCLEARKNGRCCCKLFVPRDLI